MCQRGRRSGTSHADRRPVPAGSVAWWRDRRCGTGDRVGGTKGTHCSSAGEGYLTSAGSYHSFVRVGSGAESRSMFWGKWGGVQGCLRLTTFGLQATSGNVLTPPPTPSRLWSRRHYRVDGTRLTGFSVSEAKRSSGGRPLEFYVVAAGFVVGSGNQVGCLEIRIDLNLPAF